MSGEGGREINDIDLHVQTKPSRPPTPTCVHACVFACVCCRRCCIIGQLNE